MLDIRTLVIILSIIFLSATVMLYFAYRDNKDMGGTRDWVCASALITIGLLLIFARNYIPLFISVVIANLLVQGGAALFLIGVQNFLEIKPSYRLAGIATLIFWIPYFFLYNDAAFLIYRVHISDLALVFFLIPSGYLLLRNTQQNNSTAQRLTGIAFLFEGTVCFVRSILVEIGIKEIQGYMELGNTNTFFYLLFIVSHLFLTLGLLILISERLRNRLILSLERETQARIEQSNFWSMVSHEFKTPMSIIRNSAYLITELEDNLKQASEEALTRIQRSTSRLSQLVDNSLINEWMSTTTNQLKKTEIEIAQLLENLSFEYEIPFHNNVSQPRSVFLQGDPYLLSTAISSLLDNAIKYGETKDSAYFGLNQNPEGKYTIDVYSNGPEIPDSEKERIFEKFHRQPQHRKVSGSGFGLYITAKIIELHGYQIEVIYKNGNIFRITL